MAVRLLAILILAACSADCCLAADPTFVGSLALAVGDEGARRLGLTDEVKQKLVELIDRREQEAVNLALSIKDLPPAERSVRLAPFVQESERQGMALLTVEQRTVLEQMRVAREGMNSLSEAPVGQILGLTTEQRQRVADLMAKRGEALGTGSDDERRLVRERFERELAAVLTVEQRANWERMAGLAEGSVQPAPAAPLVQSSTQFAEAQRKQ